MAIHGLVTRRVSPCSSVTEMSCAPSLLQVAQEPTPSTRAPPVLSLTFKWFLDTSQCLAFLTSTSLQQCMDVTPSPPVVCTRTCTTQSETQAEDGNTPTRISSGTRGSESGRPVLSGTRTLTMATLSPTLLARATTTSSAVLVGASVKLFPNFRGLIRICSLLRLKPTSQICLQKHPSAPAQHKTRLTLWLQLP